MNSQESRFLRIKRYSKEDLEFLQEREKAAGRDWLYSGVAVMEGLDLRYGAYWEKTRTEDERTIEVRNFLSNPVVRRAFKMLDDMNLSETAAQHKADWEVWHYAPMPSFGSKSSNQNKLSAIYSRAVKSEGDMYP